MTMTESSIQQSNEGPAVVDLAKALQHDIEKGQQALELGHVLKGILDVDDSVTPFVFKKMGEGARAPRTGCRGSGRGL